MLAPVTTELVEALQKHIEEFRAQRGPRHPILRPIMAAMAEMLSERSQGCFDLPWADEIAQDPHSRWLAGRRAIAQLFPYDRKSETYELHVVLFGPCRDSPEKIKSHWCDACRKDPEGLEGECWKMNQLPTDARVLSFSPDEVPDGWQDIENPTTVVAWDWLER